MVKASGLPAKYLPSAFANISFCGAAFANKVIDERNFIASISPKISSADCPSIEFTATVHSIRRGPSTGCFTNAVASGSPEIP